MRRIVGNPWLGLISLGLYTISFVLIDAFNSSAETGGPSPDALVGGLNVVAGLLIPLIVLAQRAPALSGRWRIANTVALVDAGLLLLFSIGHWVDILARPDDYWKPQFAPGSIGLMIVLATALAQPGDPYRRVREGLIAAASIAVPAFVGLLITSTLDSDGPGPLGPMVLFVAVVSMGLVGLIAYEFGSRLPRPAPTDAP